MILPQEDTHRFYRIWLALLTFEGVLSWGHIDNRPFLRCMDGYGLCLWRLGRFDEAERVFETMLWLNPSDNQGVRFLVEDVRARKVWEENRDQR
jgi:tetratricopeptide (TPR) repeat protein